MLCSWIRQLSRGRIPFFGKRPFVTTKVTGGNNLARIPNELIDKIRDSVNIVDVISQDVQLRKQGKNLMGRCPFHTDNTPSFAVNEEKQFFYCFSCHRSGNVFGFLQQLHNLTFPEAVHQVADMANITIPEQYSAQPAESHASGENAQLYQLHDTAAKLYHHILVNTEAGQAAMHYLSKRGMSREMIDRFNLGFAPANDNEEVLVSYAQNNQLDYQLLRKSGLFVEDRQGNLHDRFHSRVMYPIKNERGQVIAFSGRILAPKATTNDPKYMNSPETPIFDKSKTLFNLDLAKKAARSTGSLTLFEGFMDVISAFDAGVKTGVASMGTNLTEEQISIMQRLTKQVNICYDGDAPGQNAINRAVQMFDDYAPRLAIRIVQLPAGIDPDEYVQKYGSIKFTDYLANNAENAVEFKLAYLRQGLNLKNQDELLGYLNAALRVIAQVDEPVARDLYLQKLAKEFSLDKDSLRRQLEQLHVVTRPVNQRVNNNYSQQFQSHAPEPNQNGVSKVQRAEQRLLKYYISDELVRKRLQSMVQFKFRDDTYQSLFQKLKQYFADHDDYAPAAMMDRVDSPQQQRLLTTIEELTIDANVNDEAFDDCVSVIMHEAPLDEQIKEKKAALNEAAMVNDQELTTKLAAELVNLYQQQQQMKTEDVN